MKEVAEDGRDLPVARVKLDSIVKFMTYLILCHLYRSMPNLCCSWTNLRQERLVDVSFSLLPIVFFAHPLEYVRVGIPRQKAG